MEIYTIKGGFDNIVEAFIVKELAEAYLAHKSDEHPDEWFYISVLNTNDSEYAEESYIGRKIYYSATIFLDLNKNLEYLYANCRSSLKPISTYIDKDDICNEVSVCFEIDRETYDTIQTTEFLGESKLGEELTKKAIDIYNEFKEVTIEETK